MEIKPILFNTDMVRALLDGRKTVTRRVVKKSALERFTIDDNGELVGSLRHNGQECIVYPSVDDCPYQPGQILYVRETFHQTPNGQYWYKADNLCNGCTEDGFCIPKGVKQHTTCKICEYYDGYQNIKWRSSIHMTREAARIFLRVTDVRVERLQDITPEQAMAEGVIDPSPSRRPYIRYEEVGQIELYAKNKVFPDIWNSTIKPADRALYGWQANPWVWVISFERCEKPKEE